MMRLLMKPIYQMMLFIWLDVLRRGPMRHRSMVDGKLYPLKHRIKLREKVRVEFNEVYDLITEMYERPDEWVLKGRRIEHRTEDRFITYDHPKVGFVRMNGKQRGLTTWASRYSYPHVKRLFGGICKMRYVS